jgi:signal transduction histidine kinase
MNIPGLALVKRTHRRVVQSIKLRLVLVFLLLASALVAVFVIGAQRAFTQGWREAAQPILADYVDKLAQEITQEDGSPSVARALALTQRLPLTVSIAGPRLVWQSHPQSDGARQRYDRDGKGGRERWQALLTRHTPDGHSLSFGWNEDAFERQRRGFALGLLSLVLITLLAYLYVRRLLKPLDDIRAGAQRFGGGDFSQAIPVQHPSRPDELGQLAGTVNTMGRDIHQMLEAKRALLLAISHELRSPLTRARLHTELLPETGEAAAQRQALLRDLQEMSSLITDLLESERLANGHGALQREDVNLSELVQEVLQELAVRHPRALQVQLTHSGPAPRLPLDRARTRLLVRNLIDNALRHAADAPQAPEVLLAHSSAGTLLQVRDHGPGVSDEQLPQLAQAFYRPDSARTRSAGGVGLGLYLCRLVAQAHGARFELRQAQPGLCVRVNWPPAGAVSAPSTSSNPST